MEAVRVERARESEAACCLALLPEAHGLPAVFGIARRGGEFAGAAAISWRSWQDPPGLPVAIQVIPRHRRAGVGQALFSWCADLIAGEADGLWSFAAMPLAGETAGFLWSMGFRPEKAIRYFCGGIARLLADLAPLAERLRSRRRVPPGLAFAPLSEDLAEEVGWMVSRELGGGPISALHRLRRRAASGPPDGPDRSQVVLVDGAVAGAVIWRIDEGAAIVDARVVAPPWRGSALNLLMMEANLRSGLAEGLSEIRFYCEAENRDTISLAERCGAAEQPPTALWRYAAAS
ncbi:MAG: hypothetical protein ACRED8_07660 [Caulobacteraceae bacterium]